LTTSIDGSLVIWNFIANNGKESEENNNILSPTIDMNNVIEMVTKISPNVLVLKESKSSKHSSITQALW